MRHLWSALLAALMVLVLGGQSVAQSIWKSENLIADRKVKKYDLITVVIREKSKTSTSTETDTEENADLDTAVAKWFTVNGPVTNMRAVPTDTSSKLPAARLSHERERDNEGEVEHTESFEARITARVIEIMPNSNLVLEARKTVIVGEETSTLIFTGEVRRKDVKDDNTVDSDRVADAQIVYKGRGVVTDANRRGWLAKIFDFLNVF